MSGLERASQRISGDGAGETFVASAGVDAFEFDLFLIRSLVLVARIKDGEGAIRLCGNLDVMAV